MTQSSTLEQIEEIVSSLLDLGDDDAELTPETRPGDVPGWDSLANVSIVFAIEEEFGLEFSAQQLKSLATLGELARGIDSALEQSRAA